MTAPEGSSYEVVVVGAGVAGLATARALGDRHVIIVEQSDHVGGRTRVDWIAGEPASMGAGVVYRGTPTDDLVMELGIETFPVTPDNYALHWGGVTVVARTLGEIVAGLPLGQGDRADLFRALRKIADEYDHFSGHGLKEQSDALAEITFADYLGRFRPTVARLLDDLVFAHSMVRSHEVSAKYVLRYLSSKLVMDSRHAGFIRTGMQEIAFRLADAITAPIVTGQRVAAVVPEGGGYRIDLDGPGGPRSVRAREIVMAVPGPEVARIMPELPRWKVDAIKAIESVAALTVGVTLAADAESAWRHVFFVPVVDGAFDYACTMRVGPDQDKDAPNSWQLGMWRERALQEMQLTDEEIAERWLAGLDRVFPGARDAVLGWSVARWPAGFAIAKSDRRRILPEAVRAVGGVHFAGDWASESAGTHGAIESGLRAAAEVQGRLG